MGFAEELQCGAIGDKTIDVLREGSFDLRHVKSKKRGIVGPRSAIIPVFALLGPF